MTQASPIPVGKQVVLDKDMTIHYHDSGNDSGNNSGNGDNIVVFLHGSGPGASGFSNFKQNYPVFAEQGYRVIVPDLPGYGLSSKPEDNEYILDYFVGVLHQFLQITGINRCTLVGNSLGGAIALKYALDYPQEVAKLILMAPGGVEERETYFRMEGIQKMMALFTGRQLNAVTMRELMSLLVYDTTHITDTLIAERLPVCDLQPTTVLSTMRVPNMIERLGEIACPVLGFWGTDDKFNPASGAMKIMEHCRDARMLLINRCGHWVMVEHRETFNRLCLEFLASKI
ncbi:alpha/beta fold hydrolase [Collimonas antrihumi]|uniref:alpha/beta fold hydrolase n=1 Tax=Collimonas antrihumi TaxID=1940615 RepID=UPI001B8D238B|nr:alpha/beta hydrolase [Collimonas antrihumi]